MDIVSDFTDLGVLPCTIDGGIASRAAIGLLVLATDQTMEHEYRHLIRMPGVAVYEIRDCQRSTSLQKRCERCASLSLRPPS